MVAYKPLYQILFIMLDFVRVMSYSRRVLFYTWCSI